MQKAISRGCNNRLFCSNDSRAFGARLVAPGCVSRARCAPHAARRAAAIRGGKSQIEVQTPSRVRRKRTKLSQYHEYALGARGDGGLGSAGGPGRAGVRARAPLAAPRYLRFIKSRVYVLHHTTRRGRAQRATRTRGGRGGGLGSGGWRAPRARARGAAHRRWDCRGGRGGTEGWRGGRDSGERSGLRARRHTALARVRGPG